MTVPARSARRVVTNDGSVDEIEVLFPAELAVYVKVYAGDPLEGDTEQLTYGVHYTLSGIGPSTVSFIVNIVNPLAWDVDIYPKFAVFVDYPVDQQSDVGLGGTFGDRFEAALDRTTWTLQSMNDRLKRSLLMPLTRAVDEDYAIEAIPNTVIGFDENGLPIAVDPTDFVNMGGYASAAQGLLAESALQPGEAATPAQGLLADSALQPTTGMYRVPTSATLIPAPVVRTFVANVSAWYKTVASEPTHELKFLNGGRWWEIDEPVLWDFMAGSDNGALQRVLNAAYIMGIRDVKGTKAYTASAVVIVPYTVDLDGCKRRLSITQANGANLSEVVAVQDGGSLFNTIVDGNQANNTNGDGQALVRCGGNNRIAGNLLRNTPSYGLVGNGGKNIVAWDNDFDTTYSNAIADFGTVGQYAGHLYYGNRFTKVGAGTVVFQSSNGNEFSSNRTISNIIGGPEARLTVNTNAGTLRAVRQAGPTFGNVVPGMFMTMNGGAEYRVKAVISVNEIEVLQNPDAIFPTLAATPAMIGPGDQIGLIASQDLRIIDNYVEGSVTYGAGHSLGFTAVNSGKSIIKGNMFKRCGKNGFNISGKNTGDLYFGDIRDVSVVDNTFEDCGCGAGIGAVDKIGIYVSGTAGLVYDIHVSGNRLNSSLAVGNNDGRTTYWLGTDGALPVGAISADGNTDFGMLNRGIYQDVKAILTTTDWGATPTKTTVVSNADGAIITIAVGGAITVSGIGAQIGIQKIVDSPQSRPVVNAKVSNCNFVGGANLFAMFGEEQSIRGNWIAYLNGVPAAGQSYTFVFKN